MAAFGVLALTALGLAAVAGSAGKTTAGTLSMNASLTLTHGAEGPFGDCQQADDCAGRHVFGPFPGLGQVDGRYDWPIDFCGGDARPLAHPIRLTVAGKGEIRVAVAEGPCVPLADVLNLAQSFTVTGGTGSYAGASGSGTLVPSLSSTGNFPRYGTETWTGTLEVAGLEFDVTPPTLTGATNKTVRAKKGAKSARVTFRVTAEDERDGALAVSCSTRSGSAFRIGRTLVTCDASDSSANRAKASFTVTVRRRR